MKIEFLKEEPKPKTWYKQVLFCFTRPIAEFIDGFNINKLSRIAKRRQKIADMQQADFIMEVAQLLYDEVLTHGTPPNIDFCKVLCVDEAKYIFYEKKINGGFDDLNIMIEEG